MDAAPFTAVARVVSTRGLDGRVTVRLLVDLDPCAALAGRDVWPVPPRQVPRPLHVSEIAEGPGGVTAAFREVHDLGVASRLRDTLLLVATSELPRISESPSRSLVGMRVVDGERGPLGEVVDVIVTGANDVWVVHGPHGEVLLPVIDDVIVSVDAEAGTAVVRLLPGLLDEE